MNTNYDKKPRPIGRLKQLSKLNRRLRRTGKQSEFITNSIRIDQLAYVSDDPRYRV